MESPLDVLYLRYKFQPHRTTPSSYSFENVEAVRKRGTGERTQEEEPLDSAGLEELSRAYIGSNLPVGFGAKEDLVHAKCIHSVG